MRHLGVLVIGFVAGCASTSSYVYEPADRANATVSGLPASRYSVPPERPTGDVRIVSFGLTSVRAQGGSSDESIPVLQVRMVVANNGDDAPWIVDTGLARVSITGEGESAPAFVNTDAGQPPILQVARGEQRTIDLYYPLPAGVDRAERLPAFDVKWQVQTPSRVIAERTPFERTDVEPEQYQYAYGYGYPSAYWATGFGYGFGPYWWYGYPHVTFAHHGAYVVPPPHWGGHFVVAPHHVGHFAPHGYGHGYGHGGYGHSGYGHSGYGHGVGGHGVGGHGGGGHGGGGH